LSLQLATFVHFLQASDNVPQQSQYSMYSPVVVSFEQAQQDFQFFVPFFVPSGQPLIIVQAHVSSVAKRVQSLVLLKPHLIPALFLQAWSVVVMCVQGGVSAYAT